MTELLGRTAVDSAEARVEAARKTYGAAPAQVVALDDVTVTFRRGQFTAIMALLSPGRRPGCTAWPA
jgi:hypothetical protein